MRGFSGLRLALSWCMRVGNVSSYKGTPLWVPAPSWPHLLELECETKAVRRQCMHQRPCCFIVMFFCDEAALRCAALCGVAQVCAVPGAAGRAGPCTRHAAAPVRSCAAAGQAAAVRAGGGAHHQAPREPPGVRRMPVPVPCPSAAAPPSCVHACITVKLAG